MIKSLVRRLLASTTYHSGFLRFYSAFQPVKILMYHRITSPEICGYELEPGMFVRPETFAKQMKFLKSRATVLPLEEVIEAVLSRRPLPARACAITFDDGWQDNYLYAFPVLRGLELPATVFLATSFIGGARSLWSDELSWAFSQLARDDSSTASALVELGLPHGATLHSLVQVLKRESRRRRERFVERFKSKAIQLGASPQAAQFLTWHEVQEMAREGISFGAHTHHHLPLSELEPEEIRAEVMNSLAEIRQNGITPSAVFCYPEGAFSEETQCELAHCQIRAALGTTSGTNAAAVPRIFSRLGIHQDIAQTEALFAWRVWG